MKIISQAPCRISLFGGGTDLPVFYEQYGGMIISMAINIRQHIEIDTLGKCSEFLPQDNPKFFKLFSSEFNIPELTIKHTFDGATESGLGSSASLAVALVGAFARYKGLYFNRREIAFKAWELEVDKLGLYGGVQDQMASVYGGMNIFYFNKSGVQLNNIDREKAEFVKKHIILFYTGENRKDSKIQEQLKVLSEEKIMALQNIKRIAHDAKKYIYYGDFRSLGELFNASWTEKKKSNPLITTDRIDKIYDLALSYGAEGGKLMGSGGGGFMFFWAKPSDHQYIIRALEDFGCKYYDYSIDWNGLETRLL